MEKVISSLWFRRSDLAFNVEHLIEEKWETCLQVKSNLLTQHDSYVWGGDISN